MYKGKNKSQLRFKTSRINSIFINYLWQLSCTPFLYNVKSTYTLPYTINSAKITTNFSIKSFQLIKFLLLGFEDR